MPKIFVFRIEEDKDIRRSGGSWAEQPEAISKVQVRDVEPGLIAEIDQWRVFADYVRHGDFEHVPDFDWRCLGYRIEAEGKIVTISGDTVPCEGVIGLAKDADLLVQCCHLPKSPGDQSGHEVSDHWNLAFFQPSRPDCGKSWGQNGWF